MAPLHFTYMRQQSANSCNKFRNKHFNFQLLLLSWLRRFCLAFRTEVSFQNPGNISWDEWIFCPWIQTLQVYSISKWTCFRNLSPFQLIFPYRRLFLLFFLLSTFLSQHYQRPRRKFHSPDKLPRKEPF